MLLSPSATLSTRSLPIWQEAITDYRSGDFDAAFFRLGRVCHLLEDATAPVHANADVHATGDDAVGWADAAFPGLPWTELEPRRASTQSELPGLTSDSFAGFFLNVSWRTCLGSTFQAALVEELGAGCSPGRTDELGVGALSSPPMVAAGLPVEPQRTARRRLLVGGLVLAAAVAVGCSQHDAGGPNVVLISVDTLRADRLGSAGHRAALTPRVDALASSGVVFTRAYTSLPLTLPAHATMLTGLEPPAHGLVDNGMTVAGFPVPTLAERLRAAGWDTGGFVASFVLNRVFGLDRGFAHFDDGPEAERDLGEMFHGSGPAEARLDAALAWLARPRAGPFFLFLHLFDVHDPHVAPAHFAKRFAADPYDGEVAYVDEQLGRLFDFLERHDLERSTVVVFTADHGEGLGEHGETTHGVLLHDATLHVPLIVSWRGQLAPARRDEPVAVADVAPTIMALVGLAPDPRLHGRAVVVAGQRSLAPVAPRALYARSDYPARQLGCSRLRSLRQLPWKLVAGGRTELFNLAEDPGELVDVAAANPGVVRDLMVELDRTELALGSTRAATPVEPDAATRAKLAALGYLAGGRDAGARSAAGDGDCLARVTRVSAAFDLLAAGDLAAAEAALRACLVELPGHQQLALALAHCLELDGRLDEAVPVYREVVERDPTDVVALARLVDLAAWQGDASAALAWSRRLAAAAPDTAAAQRRLGQALARCGEQEAADRALARALELDPGSTASRLARCRFLLGSERVGEVADVLAPLATRQEAEVLAVRARLLAATGDLAAAEALLDRALSVAGPDPQLLTDRGLVRVLAGRAANGREDLSRSLAAWPGSDEARAALSRLGGGSAASSSAPAPGASPRLPRSPRP